MGKTGPFPFPPLRRGGNTVRLDFCYEPVFQGNRSTSGLPECDSGLPGWQKGAVVGSGGFVPSRG